MKLLPLARGIADTATFRAVDQLERFVKNLVSALFTATSPGIVPASGGGTVNFLRADGTWQPGVAGVPPTRLVNTTAPLAGGGDLSADRTLSISSFSGSSPGAVPTSPGGTTQFLRADGSWALPPGILPNQLNTGWFGFGGHGAITFDGTTTVTVDGTAIVPVASVYTLPQSLSCTNLTVNNGVTLKLNGWHIDVTGTLTNNGTISDNGANGANGVAGSGNGTGGAGGGARGANYYSATIPGAQGGLAPGSAPDLGTGPRGVLQVLAQSACGGWGIGVAGAGSPGSTGGLAQGGGGGGGGGTSLGSGTNTAGNGGAIALANAADGNVDLVTATRAGVLLYSSTQRVTLSGSGGGGGGSGGNGVGSGGGGGGGGAGGGMVGINARILAGNGVFQALGGNGGNGAGGTGGGGSGGGGGGGGGGIMIITYATNTGTCTFSVAGGSGGTGAAGGGGGGPGGNGGPGGTGFLFKNNTSGDGT